MTNKNSSKNHSGYALTSKDKEAIDIFSDLGLPKNLAKTLLYVSNVDECRSADIERGAGLRQPEVSIAMQELLDKGWITKRNQRKEGKGRPIYIYKLTSPLSSIMNHIEEEKSKEIQSIKQELKELKSILEKRDDFQK